MTLVGSDLDFELPLNRSTRGSVGQVCRIRSICAPDFADLQRICRSRRRGDVCTIDRHLRQTCARRCHFHGRPRE